MEFKMSIIEQAVDETQLVVVKFYLKALEDYPLDMVKDMMKQEIERLENGSQE
jgi:hypothetical protein